jgi:hypothetical protein
MSDISGHCVTTPSIVARNGTGEHGVNYSFM